MRCGNSLGTTPGQAILDYEGYTKNLAFQALSLRDRVLDIHMWMAPQETTDVLDEAHSITQSPLNGFRKSFQDTVEKRLNAAEQNVGHLRVDHEALAATVHAHRNLATEHASELHTFLWMTGVGVDFRSAALRRYIPVRVFVSDPLPSTETLNRIVVGVKEFGEAIGLFVTEELPGERGSWWKKLVLRTRHLHTQADLDDSLSKAKTALEISHLDKPQAEANKLQAEAAGVLIKSLGVTAEACIQVGSLLLVKRKSIDGSSAIVVRTLSPTELKRLEANQRMLERPADIVEWLSAPLAAEQSTHDRRVLPPSAPPLRGPCRKVSAQQRPRSALGLVAQPCAAADAVDRRRPSKPL